MGVGPSVQSSRRLGGLWLSVLALFAGTSLTDIEFARAQGASTNCAPTIGRIVSLQGEVEVQRAGSADWSRVQRLDTAICAGDRLRTAALSRAALFVQPETLVRVDQHTTITLHQSTDEIFVEFQTEQALLAARDAQSCGAGYFITRFPRKFKVATPHVNAAVEGTEFMVESSCDATKLTVLEGKVLSQTATQEQRAIAANESLVAGTGKPTVFSTVIKPADAVQWVLRYPPLSDAGSSAEIPTAEECRVQPTASRAACLTRRAETLLRLGRVDEALSNIDASLTVDSTNGDASALGAIIQITKNDKQAALESAERAVAADASNYRAWLALSYAQQASFELDQALESARMAQKQRSDSSLIHARISELLLSLGNSKDAEESARLAVAVNPAESAAHTVLGFVHLATIETDAAQADFAAAIEHDSFNPLPRLGHGLAMIRVGKLVRGREELEIAVALDPGNSLVRSYVGKAYYEENSGQRNELAAAQFELAKQLDRLDPTPWYYDAILKESQNRPVDALQELQTSIENNGNRAVYRSKLLLDDDAAARTASVAAIYDSLGFERLAILESAKALGESAGNYSAHRQLSGAYADLPRHDIARVSEALQAQIRQPVSLASLGPQLTTDNLLINRNTGPARPGAYEFNALFNRNDLRIDVDGLAGGLDTYGNQFVASGLMNNFSYTLSQLHYETDGFVENDAAERDIYDLFVHGQITPNSTVQLDAKRSDFSSGQTIFPFDEFPTPTSILEQSDTLRISGHHVYGYGSDVIWSAVVEDRERAVRGFPDGGLFFSSDASPYAVEVQFLGQAGDTQLVVGGSIVEDKERFDFEDAVIRNESANAYAYARWRRQDNSLSLQVGIAGERFKSTLTSTFSPDGDTLDRSRLSPKLGLIWSPRVGTTVRAAAFSSVHRPFIRSQTIEPTQVAGFNQFFSGFDQFYGDFIGTISDRIGVAVDQAFTSTAFGGVELTSRHLEVPSFVLDRDFTWREETGHVYFYKTYAPASYKGWFARWQAAISADIAYEKVERPQILTGAEGIMDLETTMAPIGVQLFSEGGTTLRLATTYVEQDGVFSIDVGLPIVETEDDAWITDLTVEHRLPRRKGVIAVGVRNLFDVAVDLVEIDPVNPRVATELFLYARFSLGF